MGSLFFVPNWYPAGIAGTVALLLDATEGGLAYPGSLVEPLLAELRPDAKLYPFALAAAVLEAEVGKLATDDAAALKPVTGTSEFGVLAAIEAASGRPPVPPATEAIASGVADSLGGAG